MPENLEIYFATNSEYPFGAFKPVPTAVPPRAISDRWGKEFFKDLTPYSNCE